MSIQLSLDGLSYSVFDPINNIFVAYGYRSVAEPDVHFAHHEELMLTNDIFKEPYRHVSISVESNGFTLVPNQLFDEEKTGELLTFAGHAPEADSHLMHDKIEMANAVLLYSIPNFLFHFLKVQFGSVSVMNAALPMVSAMLMKREKSQSREQIGIMLNAGKMTIAATRDNILQLCTEYSCNDVNDYVYMTMNAMQQMQFSANETQIGVGGALEPDDERVALLRRFARNVRLWSMPRYFDFDFTVDQPQRFANLFNMTLCE